ncbi:MAG: hypothetical protein QW320_09725 [Ignisphaera sp.]
MGVELNRVYHYYGAVIIPLSSFLMDGQRITTLRGVLVIKDGSAYIIIGNPYELIRRIKSAIAEEELEKML